MANGNAQFFQAPDKKVNVGGAMTFLSTIVAWATAEFAGIEIPAPVAIAMAGFASWVVQYIVPNS